MENKLNESEDNKEEGEKGGKKEEVGDKRSPILGRQKKRFAKDDNKNNNNNNNNNKQEDTDDEIIPGTPQKIKPVRVVKKKYTDYSNHQAVNSGSQIFVFEAPANILIAGPWTG